ncbi:unnamed protein product [Fusarium graminearum]|nr:unnamed protein product [Fusarium graminearum]
MYGDENPPKSSSGVANALAEWYTCFGSLFAGLFCVACILRVMGLISTAWTLLFLLPTVSCFLTAAVLAHWLPSANPWVSYHSQENSNQATDDGQDNGKAANATSLNNTPPIYNAETRLVYSMLPRAFTDSGYLVVSRQSKGNKGELI